MKLGSRSRFVIGAVAFMVLLGFLMRVGFYSMFHQGARPAGGSATAFSFYLGAKFDVRLALLLCLPFYVFARFRILDPARTPRAKIFWSGQFALLTTCVFGLCGSDCGPYASLEDRLHAAALRCRKNPIFSAQRVGET